MTGLRIIPDPDSFARAERELSRLAGQTSNLPGALKNIGEALLRTTRARFSSRTGPDGAAWPAHAPLTLLTGGRPGNMLRRSGRLYRSINYRVGGSTLTVGANAPPYDRVQQFGATIRPKKGKFLAVPVPAQRGGRNGPSFMFLKKVTIPARPYIGFGPKDEAATLREIHAWLAIEGEAQK